MRALASTNLEQSSSGGFESLPTEVVLKMFLAMSDLASLGNLIRASPTAYRTFATFAVEITETVLTLGTTPRHVKDMFRVIVSLRSGTLPMPSLVKFRKDTMEAPLRPRHSKLRSRRSLIPGRLATDVCPAVLRSVLVVAANIALISLDCIQDHLAQFTSLKPVVPADESLGRLPEGLHNKTYCRPPSDFMDEWRSGKPGIEVALRDVGPPSWVEEQRVDRAYWRLQLVCEVKQAARRCLLQWPDDDVEEVKDMSAVDYPACDTGISSQWGCDDETDSEWEEDDRHFYTLTKLSDERDHRLAPEFQDIVSVINHVRRKYGPDFAMRLAEGRLCLTGLIAACPPLHRTWPVAEPGEDDEDQLAEVPPWTLFDNTMLGRTEYGFSHVPIAQMHVYERYGFGFWSRERLQEYGLLPTSSLRDPSSEELRRVQYATQSILNAEEYTSLKERFRRRDIWREKEEEMREKEEIERNEKVGNKK